jgi:hypothetical protein
MATIEQCPKINQGAIIALGILCGLLFVGVTILLLLLAKIVEGRLDRIERRRSRIYESDEYLEDIDLDADRTHRWFLRARNHSIETVVTAPDLVAPRTRLERGPIRYRSGQWRGHAHMEALRDSMRLNQLIQHRRGSSAQRYGTSVVNPRIQAIQPAFMQEIQLPAQQAFRPPVEVQHATQNHDAQLPRFQQPLRQEVIQSPRFQQLERQGGMAFPRDNLFSRRHSNGNNLDSGGPQRGVESLENEQEDNGIHERDEFDREKLEKEARNSRADSTYDQSAIHATKNQHGEALARGRSRKSHISSSSEAKARGIARNGLDGSGRPHGGSRNIRSIRRTGSDASGKAQGNGKSIREHKDVG